MFGKIEWFQTSKNKAIITPVSWHGWAYLGGMAAAVLAPLKLLLAIGHTPEAFIWFLVSSGVAAFDYYKVNRGVRQKAEYEKLFFIKDDEVEEVVTADA